MGYLNDYKYKVNLTNEKKKELGFKYDYELGDYVLKFTVYKYGKIPLIFCKLGIDEETNMIWHCIYDASNNLYTPYYNREYGRNNIVPKIEKEVKKKLNELGAKSVNENDKHK